MVAPLIFSDQKSASRLTRQVAAGSLRRVARGVYTTDLTTPLEELARRHWLQLVAHFFPGAVISDRSAPRGGPDTEGRLFVVHGRKREVAVPGLLIIPRKGPGALDDDTETDVGLKPIYFASPARALLENCAASRARNGRPRRTLSTLELQQWVMRLRQTEGADRLEAYRDRARQLAKPLGLEAELERLDDVMGAALEAREVETASPALTAAPRGVPYDERRIDTLSVLVAHLRDLAPAPRLQADSARLAMLPFFEAYFSNVIEGIDFTVEEAREIVFGHVLPAQRRADAHDLLGTFEIVSEEAQMRRTPRDADDLIQLLLARHGRVMAARPELSPGDFKTRGTTEFVRPELVRGTLQRGFELASGLGDPFARAVYLMFLVSEVHPFADGNGRIARVMMNAELHAAGESRIIIPTVYRNEYLSGLRALTTHGRPGPLVRVLEFAQRYTRQLDFSSIEAAKRLLTETNAFLDSTEAEARGVRLVLPASLQR